MTDFSRNLSLPFLMPQQAQKHVTVNEALEVLDTVIQLSVVSMSEPEPLAGAVDGDRYIVPTGATGAFSGQDGQVAWREQGVWQFLTPQEGWTAWVGDAQQAVVLSAGGWTAPETAFQQLGVNAAPDAVNRLAVASEAALFSHDGTDHRLKINRSGASDTASILFQTGFTGGAEIGLAGAIGLALRTSPNGTAWQTRLDCPDGSPGIRTPGVRSGEISLAVDTVADIPTPETAGMFLFWDYDDIYPNVKHSGIFVFDTGPSLKLETVFLGESATNNDDLLLTGTAGPSNRTNVSVQTGLVQIENRQTGAAKYRYIFLA